MVELFDFELPMELYILVFLPVSNPWFKVVCEGGAPFYVKGPLVGPSHHWQRERGSQIVVLSIIFDGLTKSFP